MFACNSWYDWIRLYVSATCDTLSFSAVKSPFAMVSRLDAVVLRGPEIFLERRTTITTKTAIRKSPARTATRMI